jgi:hypothetical protein
LATTEPAPYFQDQVVDFAVQVYPVCTEVLAQSLARGQQTKVHSGRRTEHSNLFQGV